MCRKCPPRVCACEARPAESGVASPRERCGFRQEMGKCAGVVVRSSRKVRACRHIALEEAQCSGVAARKTRCLPTREEVEPPARLAFGVVAWRRGRVGRPYARRACAMLNAVVVRRERATCPARQQAEAAL